jgi:serine protease Do
VKSGVVHRAKLGVTIQNVTPDLASSMGLPAGQHGAVVSSVEEGGPAARAGFKQGDVITQYNGKAITDNNQLRNEVAGTAPGTTVAVEVLRNGRSETLHATVGELSPAGNRASSKSGENGEGGKYGMSVQPLTPELAEQAGVPRGTQGVLVAGVDPDGIAADSGIQEGDVIEKVNGKAVTSVDTLKSALESNNGKPSLLLVNRKDGTIFLTLKAR